MKFRVKQYYISREYILHNIAAQIKLSFNHVIKDPWYEPKKKNMGLEIKGSVTKISPMARIRWFLGRRIPSFFHRILPETKDIWYDFHKKKYLNQNQQIQLEFARNP